MEFSVTMRLVRGIASQDVLPTQQGQSHEARDRVCPPIRMYPGPHRNRGGFLFPLPRQKLQPGSDTSLHIRRVSPVAKGLVCVAALQRIQGVEVLLRCNPSPYVLLQVLSSSHIICINLKRKDCAQASDGALRDSVEGRRLSSDHGCSTRCKPSG